MHRPLSRSDQSQPPNITLFVPNSLPVTAAANAHHATVTALPMETEQGGGGEVSVFLGDPDSGMIVGGNATLGKRLNGHQIPPEAILSHQQQQQHPHGVSVLGDPRIGTGYGRANVDDLWCMLFKTCQSGTVTAWSYVPFITIIFLASLVVFAVAFQKQDNVATPSSPSVVVDITSSSLEGTPSSKIDHDEDNPGSTEAQIAGKDVFSTAKLKEDLGYLSASESTGLYKKRKSGAPSRRNGRAGAMYNDNDDYDSSGRHLSIADIISASNRARGSSSNLYYDDEDDKEEEEGDYANDSYERTSVVRSLNLDRYKKELLLAAISEEGRKSPPPSPSRQQKQSNNQRGGSSERSAPPATSVAGIVVIRDEERGVIATKEGRQTFVMEYDILDYFGIDMDEQYFVTDAYSCCCRTDVANFCGNSASGDLINAAFGYEFSYVVMRRPSSTASNRGSGGKAEKLGRWKFIVYFNKKLLFNEDLDCYFSSVVHRAFDAGGRSFFLHGPGAADIPAAAEEGDDDDFISAVADHDYNDDATRGNRGVGRKQQQQQRRPKKRTKLEGSDAVGDYNNDDEEEEEEDKDLFQRLYGKVGRKGHDDDNDDEEEGDEGGGVGIIDKEGKGRIEAGSSVDIIKESGEHGGIKDNDSNKDATSSYIFIYRHRLSTDHFENTAP